MMIKKIKAFAAKLVVFTGMSLCLITNTMAAGSDYPLQKAPKNSSDLPAVQDGARTFVNYCLNCHAASALRYNQLTKIGLSEAQIKDNLLFTSDKTGSLMTVAMTGTDAKTWFGAIPPDLSLVARSRGTDWLYTYMRSFYLDKDRATGWNNALYPNVGMPHVLWEWQGQNAAKFKTQKDPHDANKEIHLMDGFEKVKTGTLSASEYDEKIANLVAFMDWMAEPKKNDRTRTGMWVLFYLTVLTIFAWALNKNYWKDIR